MTALLRGLPVTPSANEISNSLVPFERATTRVAVIELGHGRWLISRSAPGVDAAVTKTLAKAIEARGVDLWRQRASCRPGGSQFDPAASSPAQRGRQLRLNATFSRQKPDQA